MIRGARTGRHRSAVAGAVGAGAVLLSGLLTACSADDAPTQVTNVRWQLTGIGDADLGATAQVRTWLVLGASTVTGASGCVRFTGEVDWSGPGNSGTVTLSDLDTTTEDGCGAGDRSTAERMMAVLDTPGLQWAWTDNDGDNPLHQLRLWADDAPEHSIRFTG